MEEMGESSVRTISLTRTDEGTPFTSPSLSYSNRPLRIRIRPNSPLKQRPLLLPCLENTTITAFKERITNLLKVTQAEGNCIRLEIDGFTIAEDCLVGDIIRESDLVDVYWDGDQNSITEMPIDSIKRNNQGTKRNSASSSSSSSESSSEESSSSDSSSEDDSTGSDDDEPESQAVNQWVPPGQGSLRTRKNNQRKRKKARIGLDAERENRLIETIKKAEQAGLGTEQSRAGGRTKSQAQKLPEIRRILPPSQRDEEVPSSIRLTRVDCDECMTPWPEDEQDEEEEGEDDEEEEQEESLYIAFKRQGEEALRRMRAEEMHSENLQTPSDYTNNEGQSETSEQALLGLPMAFGKPKGWNGNDVLTSGKENAQQALMRLRKLRDSANQQLGGLDAMRSAALATLKKKQKMNTDPEDQHSESSLLSLPPGGGMLGLPSLPEETNKLPTPPKVTNQNPTHFVVLDELADEEGVPQFLDYGQPEDEGKERTTLQKVFPNHLW